MPLDTLSLWHEAVRRGDGRGLDDVLADSVVFHSPIVHTPQVGRVATRRYLTAAFAVLGGAAFRYVRELKSDREAILEFEAEVDGVQINGVDIICWENSGRIVSFKVMVRPLKAINLVHAKMARALESGSD
jgi:hypothetical protein